MTSRDDMVIVPRLRKPGQPSARQRAADERRSDVARKRRGRLFRRIRRARLARRAALGGRGISRRIRTGNLVKTGIKAGRTAVKVGSRLAGALGLVMLAADAVILGAVAVRRVRGASIRLIQAQDAHTLYGDLDEQATAAAEARGFIEGNSDLLRIIAIEGRVNSQILGIANFVRKDALDRARANDLIERYPGFDSADTVVDQWIKQTVVSIKAVADDAIDALRDFMGGTTPKAR